MIRLLLLVTTLVAPGVRSTAQTSLEPPTSHLIVTIAPVRVEDGGELLVALFRDKASWLDLDQAAYLYRSAADQDTTMAHFAALQPGRYAAEVVHDKNENGKFDMRWFPYPKPKEGAGVSNNARRMGKPDYDAALFTIGGDTTAIVIELFY